MTRFDAGTWLTLDQHEASSPGPRKYRGQLRSAAAPGMIFVRDFDTEDEASQWTSDCKEFARGLSRAMGGYSPQRDVGR